MMKLQDKVALITGGTTGIGLAAAKLFHAEGARVFVTGRSEAGIAEARKQLPPEVEVLPSDAADLADVQALAGTLKTRAGRIDVLFVNAGIARFLPIESVTPQAFDEQFGVNVRGAYFTIQQILPLMSSGGSIVLTTSVAADLGTASTSVYSATKAALSSLARTLANELAPRGIRVNEVSPGPIETPIFGKIGLTAEQVDGMSALVPLKRLGTAEEVARAALFLASADSSFLLGAKVRIDGGLALN
ncbi:MAG TPA: SDR family oxidoreductase [Burkholderiales bacterium]|jgi:NAD(P)-dependent dehydrogenase (short-subunit alcohol dehydrogenase family)